MGAALSGIVAVPALMAGGVFSAIVAGKLKSTAKDTSYQNNADVKKARQYSIIMASVMISLAIVLFIIMVFFL